MLDKDVFFQLNRLWGPLLVDLFASRLTCQCEVFYSWRPDPCAAATDAFLQDWSELKAYANPPWNLVGRVLTKVRIEKATVVLVAPVWKAQSWYPTLLEMAMDSPRLFPWQPQATCSSSMEAPALAAWLVSGNAALSTTFRKELVHSSRTHGGRGRTSPTTRCSGSGAAGVVYGVQIPFLDLQ